MHNIIALWTHPRSRSTAFERVMIERGDLHVLHEPFSYVYYVHEGRATIAQEYIDAAHPRTYADIKQYICVLSRQSPVFFKDMCAHCYDHLQPDEVFLLRLSNTFLIREPSRAIASYYHLNPHVTCEEIGYEQLWGIFDQVRRLTGRVPVVVNADDLVRDPPGMMQAYCQALGLVFRPDTLHWQAGHQAAWDIWKRWHRDVAQSTQLMPATTTYEATVENHALLRAYDDYHRPFYEAMNRHRLTVR